MQKIVWVYPQEPIDLQIFMEMHALQIGAPQNHLVQGCIVQVALQIPTVGLRKSLHVSWGVFKGDNSGGALPLSAKKQTLAKKGGMGAMANFKRNQKDLLQTPVGAQGKQPGGHSFRSQGQVQDRRGSHVHMVLHVFSEALFGTTFRIKISNMFT